MPEGGQEGLRLYTTEPGSPGGQGSPQGLRATQRASETLVPSPVHRLAGHGSAEIPAGCALQP